MGQRKVLGNEKYGSPNKHLFTRELKNGQTWQVDKTSQVIKKKPRGRGKKEKREKSQLMEEIQEV